jgi:hypothetical protein
MRHSATFKQICLMLAAAVILLETACRDKSTPPVLVYRMGDKVQAGPLVYTIISSEWKSQLGSGEQVSVPSKRFLLIHLTVTNGAAETISVPQLMLADESGQTYNESTAGADAPALWGLIRNVKPAGTLEGHVLFDVEPKSYKLKVEGGPGSNEVAAVEIPLQFELKRSDIPSAIH